jgi:hypothetical protein
MSSEPDNSITVLDIESPSFRMTPIGIEFLSELSREDWAKLGQKLGSAGKSLGFLIGDWLNYGDGKGDWGDTYTEAMAITGLEYKTLQMYATVSRKVQMTTRVGNLAFELHRKVAPIKDPQQQKKWLRVAEKQAEKGKPISSRRLAKSILLDRLATDKDMTTPEHKRGRDNVIPHVLRLVQFWRKLDASGWKETADLLLVDHLINDLKPVLKIHDELCVLKHQLEADTDGNEDTEPGREWFRGP